MGAPTPRTITVALGGELDREGLLAARARIAGLVGIEGADVALCDVAGLRADAVAVESLGLLQLTGRREGWQVRLLNPSRDLLELIAFMGLADVLPRA
jgi:ABC-type transporter Mla MlaB component